MVNLAGGCSECSGGIAFAFYCSKIDPARPIASEEDRSLIKKEWKTGKFNNIIKMEIEIPTWCPLPDKE